MCHRSETIRIQVQFYLEIVLERPFKEKRRNGWFFLDRLRFLLLFGDVFMRGWVLIAVHRWNCDYCGNYVGVRIKAAWCNLHKQWLLDWCTIIAAQPATNMLLLISRLNYLELKTSMFERRLKFNTTYTVIRERQNISIQKYVEHKYSKRATNSFSFVDNNQTLKIQRHIHNIRHHNRGNETTRKSPRRGTSPKFPSYRTKDHRPQRVRTTVAKAAAIASSAKALRSWGTSVTEVGQSPGLVPSLLINNNARK